VLTVPECNTPGLALLGGAPLGEALEAAVAGRVDTLVILENDLFRRAPAGAVRTALESLDEVNVLDHLAHDTGALADLILPAATFAEGSGTLVNNEGRAQRFYQVFEPGEPVREGWRWLVEAMRARDPEKAPDWVTLDDVVAAIGEEIPSLAGIPDAAPAEDYRVDGARIPRQPHRYSGRTAMRAHRSVHEPKPDTDPDSPLADSMEGYDGQPPAALLSNYWAPRWNSVQALNRFQEEIAGPLRGGDAGVRLLEPPREREPRYFTEISESGNGDPGRSKSPPGDRSPGEDRRLRLVPLHHVFGSEELSSLARGVSELAPEPYLALHPETASRLGLGEGAPAELILEDGRTVRSSLRLRDDLAAGGVGVPFGLSDGLQGPLPRKGRIRRRKPGAEGDAWEEDR
ncbi:MAG: molybdopterin-dependent oxidoreductase, partial [Thermoanaerobaculia bacterium]|nr:molybdopterin-dependent oxidoreductase [Thermoanaerobaculia bacterium]